MSSLKLFWSYMKGNRLLYIGALVSVALATFFSILNPLVLRVTIDSIIGDKPLDLPRLIGEVIKGFGGKEVLEQNLWVAGVIMVGLTLLQGIFLYFKGKWSAIAAESIAKNTRERLYDHLQHLPYEYHTKAETGDLIQRCTSDVDTVRRFLAVQFVEVGRAIFMMTFVAIIMFSLDMRLTLVAIGVVPIILAFSYFFYKEVKKSFKDADEAEGRMSTVLQENLTGVRVVRAFARQNYEIDKFDKESSGYRAKCYRVLRLLAWFWSVSDFLCMLQIGIVLIFGSYWAFEGSITLGTLVVFVTYEGMLLWPVRQLGRILTDMGKTLVALGRIQEVLDEVREEENDSDFKPALRGNIKFEKVYFEYEEGKGVLKDISFEVNEGETIAILGATGSGKSSLVHLLARLYDYQQGSIKIDGYEIKDINKKWLRRHIGLVLQEPFLFAKSVKENIGLARSDVRDTEIFEAANNAAIHDVILDFEKGYDTIVGERGVSLSGGQKQRVAIARTLIRECPILIFDDSLSAVDTETDATIRQELKKKKENTTTFIISHRINTLAEADKILVIDDGKIVEAGTHQDLINKEGMYKRVWEIQNSLEQEMEVG
ncbi:ATP-binding cassette subfamily B protein [Orenia metallireducens]|uniref:ABC transporter ATP-binding protein n=1 Tax=Orenia metallireducens TaxID=1413210 RepID=UPI000D457790|nr:ABC transporter ATP-binding protein [Orenia metallireducens]PRX31034.1 ATP-binding cassette subfamily B protein [Orenia metallireducens]